MRTMRAEDINIATTGGMKRDAMNGQNGENDHAAQLQEDIAITIQNGGRIDGEKLMKIVGPIEIE